MMNKRKYRYPVVWPVTFRQGHHSGSGHTVNMSSCGMLIRSTDPIVLEDPIELKIKWPVRLNDRVPLMIKIKGRIVRADNNGFAVVFDRYQFFTRSIAMEMIA